jgi:FkbM family methyltransferase
MKAPSSRRWSLRRVVERLSRGVVLSRRLPAEFGKLPLYVSPEAGLGYWRWRTAKVDPLLFRLARELVQPGAVVWDVGANVGLFAFSAAARAGPSGSVLAIEPDFWLAHLLTLSSHRLQRGLFAAAPVKVLCAAVSKDTGVSQLEIAERARAASHLTGVQGSSQAEGCRYVQQTTTISLDFLLGCFPPPSVLKIDVESAEIQVLEGASRLLRSARPVIWCEVAADNASMVTAILHRHGYELFAADLELAERSPVARAPWNTLAVPAVR